MSSEYTDKNFRETLHTGINVRHSQSSFCNAIPTSGSGQLEFEEFAELAAKFLIEEDQEALQTELKEAFRIYDREGKWVGVALSTPYLVYILHSR